MEKKEKDPVVKVVKEEPKKPTGPRMVEVRLPKLGRSEENNVRVKVNGKGYQIMRGVPVMVPDFVAEVLENSERAAEVAEAYIEQNVQ